MKFTLPVVDVLLITSIGITLSRGEFAGNIVTGAVPFIYFIFIILCALRNSRSSVIITGICTAVAYSCLSFYHCIVDLKIFELGGNHFYNDFGKLG